MKTINNITIDQTPMSSEVTTRVFTVEGDPGAKFTMTVTNEDAHFYNFSEDTDVAVAFSSTAAKLKQKIIGSSGIYTGSIEFPAITDDDHYIITLYADTASETVLSKELSNNEIYTLPKIHKYHDTTITFSLSSAASSGSYNSMPSNVTFTSPSYLVKENSPQTATINWGVSLSTSQFVIARQPRVNDFEFTTTKDTRTSGSGTSLELKNIEGLSIGMGVSGTGIASGSVITDIRKGYLNANKSYDDNNVYTIPKVITQDVNNEDVIVDDLGGTVTIDQSSTFVADRTLTFTGSGSNDSKTFNNTSFSINNLQLTIDPVTTTTDSAVSSSTTIPIASTDGIKAAEGVIMSGVGVVGTPHVDAVSAGVNVTASAAQTIENGQTITFTGSSRTATITADVTVLSHGDDDMTLTLALDNILTVG
jgi:Fe-S cluster assembly iron-binding protein IscA